MKFSRLMLGTVQFGLNYGIANRDGKPSEAKIREIILTAWENGVNCLDTAAGYGDSEVVVGNALSELGLKEKMQIISKVPGVGDRTPAEAEAFIVGSIEESLRRLGVDRLDGCLFHRETDYRYLDELQKLVQRGLIGTAGISLDTNHYCRNTVDAGIRYVQIPCNVLDYRFEDFLNTAMSQNITVFARSVYLQGLLLMPESEIIPSLQDVIPVRRQLAKIAHEAGMELAELCMRYVLSLPAVTSILTGVDTVDQLRQNLNLFSRGALPEDLCRAIRNTVPRLSEKVIRPALWTKS